MSAGSTSAPTSSSSFDGVGRRRAAPRSPRATGELVEDSVEQGAHESRSVVRRSGVGRRSAQPSSAPALLESAPGGEEPLRDRPDERGHLGASRFAVAGGDGVGDRAGRGDVRSRIPVSVIPSQRSGPNSAWSRICSRTSRVDWLSTASSRKKPPAFRRAVGGVAEVGGVEPGRAGARRRRASTVPRRGRRSRPDRGDVDGEVGELDLDRPRSRASAVRRAASAGAMTKLPPSRPRRVSTRPASRRMPRPSRAVTRATPNRRASSASLGRRSPATSTPRTIASVRRWATCSARPASASCAKTASRAPGAIRVGPARLGHACTMDSHYRARGDAESNRDGLESFGIG